MGSRDRDNSTVQTAAMGQIPRSTVRILVCTKMQYKELFIVFLLTSLASCNCFMLTRVSTADWQCHRFVRCSYTLNVNELNTFQTDTYSTVARSLVDDGN